MVIFYKFSVNLKEFMLPRYTDILHERLKFILKNFSAYLIKLFYNNNSENLLILNFFTFNGATHWPLCSPVVASSENGVPDLARQQAQQDHTGPSGTPPSIYKPLLSSSASSLNLSLSPGPTGSLGCINPLFVTTKWCAEGCHIHLFRARGRG